MGEEPHICPALVGPTAVGKTGLVTKLAARLPLEVISLDSRQIYRGLRIGTAQPTVAEQEVCPHHLIDFIDPTEKYDAVRFRRDFQAVYQQIIKRGARPLLVGGAGMYLTALREGFLEIPGHTPEKLREVRDFLDAWSDDEIRRELERVDPDSAARVHLNDRYRGQRALEIQRIAGQTMTELVAGQKPDPVLGLEFPAFVLHRPVPELDARIARRTTEMLNGGWITETEELLDSSPPDCPGLRSIGYREIVAHLQGALSAEELPAAIILATRQYAKRQRTMFRHLTAEGNWHPEEEELVEILSRYLEMGD